MTAHAGLLQPTAHTAMYGMGSVARIQTNCRYLGGFD